MDTAQILTDLRAQRERITAAITALESLTGSTPAPAAKTPASAAAKSVKTTSASTKRAVSPEGRQRMAEAQQKRWAKKKLAMAAKARWAAKKAPAKMA